ncbi:MAG: hypothetical protein PGN11_18390 [Quadrisphaera sp.]
MHLPRRALAASALALASLTAATGCTYTNAQQTAASYAPGAAAAVSLGTVHVAGLFVATGGEGPASLVARIVNSGDDAVSVKIAGTGDASSLSGTFQVQPATTYDVGPAGEQTVTASSFSTPPGQVITMEVTAAGDTQQLAVPVLDGTLEQYAQYVPTATPTTTPHAAGHQLELADEQPVGLRVGLGVGLAHAVARALGQRREHPERRARRCHPRPARPTRPRARRPRTAEPSTGSPAPRPAGPGAPGAVRRPGPRPCSPGRARSRGSAGPTGPPRPWRAAA